MISHVTVYTAKLTETVEFYQWLLGLPVSNKIDRAEGTIIFLGEDETKFEIIQDQNAGSVDAKGLTIGFAVDDLDQKLALLESKEIPHSEIIAPTPVVRFAFFTDLNGCSIQLFEHKSETGA